MTLRASLAGLLLFALSGCVAFEHAPPDLSCDPALVGQWRSIEDSPRIDVAVDAQCRARVTWPDETVEITLRSYGRGGVRYLALSPREAESIAGEGGEGLESIMPANSTLLVAYRIRGKRLRAYIPDAEAVQASRAAGKLKASPLTVQDEDKHDHDNSLVVHSDAHAIARLLDTDPDALFGDLDASGAAATELKRVGAAPAKAKP
ncbi:hypothetical protein V1318_12920 [Lysobacter sp. CCNWLW3]|uniref:hypothetical protein n=1 Tax=unclassified Lysobacter TaxID=2635362 RepID=UPI002FD6EA57